MPKGTPPAHTRYTQHSAVEQQQQQPKLEAELEHARQAEVGSAALRSVASMAVMAVVVAVASAVAVDVGVDVAGVEVATGGGVVGLATAAFVVAGTVERLRKLGFPGERVDRSAKAVRGWGKGTW